MSQRVAPAMVDPQEPSMESLEGRRRRSNVRLAIVHVLIALGILAAFVWAQVHR